MKAIKNVKLLQNNTIVDGKAVLYDNRIIDIVDTDSLSSHVSCTDVIDGCSMYLSAGFIDVHIHGCSSYDAMDSAEDNLEIISKNLARTGVTAFLPTTMTLPLDQVERTLQKIRSCMGNVSGSQILGCHLEGPFISKLFKGAHDESFIVPPDTELVRKYADVLRIITLAPELEGSLSFIDLCKELGIIVSLGHTATDYDTAVKAIERGATHFTHTCNAMTPLKHREPGAVGAALSQDVTCEIIADNVHIHPAVQKIIIQAKGYQRVILVTDAMRACLMCDGTYNLGGQQVIVSDRQARLSNGTLAGSVLTLNTALKNIITTTGLPLACAIDMITVNPAKLLQISSQKGSIETGKDADFAIFDSHFNVHYTIAGGKIIYRS